MKNLILIAFLILPLKLTKANDTSLDLVTMTKAIQDKKMFYQIERLALNNGFKPKKEVIKAIIRASKQYKINHLELSAIAIVETGIGSNIKTRLNKNKTHDVGLFQINTINKKFCNEYNVYSLEGSALCAAKLLDFHRKTRKDYLGVYHSKTPSKKAIYLKKISKVLKNSPDEYLAQK